MVLRRYALSIIALAILESSQWLKTRKRHPCEVNPKSFCLTFGVHFNIEDFKQALKQYIRYYNYDRIKIKLKMSPVKYRTHFQNIVN